MPLTPKHSNPSPPKPKPPPSILNTSRKQYLRAKGWIPPKGYTEVHQQQPPPTTPHPYSAHPATINDMAATRGIRYSLAQGPALLWITRIIQITLAVIYLILLAYSGVHHGWWQRLGKPLGFGITASLLTLVIAIPSLLGYSSANATHSLRKFCLHYSRVIAEWVLIALWAAAFVTMLLPKGKNFRLLFDKPPYAEWDSAVALAALEVIAFLLSMVLVLQEKYYRVDQAGSEAQPFSATVELARGRR